MKFPDSLRRLFRRHPWLKAASAPVLSRVRSRKMDRAATYRDVLSNLSRVLACDPVIRLTAFRGDFAVSAESDLFRRVVSDQEYETDLASLAVELVDPGRDVIDVGANVGFYTVLFAKLLNSDRRVLAIEPVQTALARLLRNLEANRVRDKVIVVAGLASNSIGRSHVNVIPGKEEYSSTGDLVHPSTLNFRHARIEVPAHTVDELVDTYDLAPGFIKVDVEGAEQKVIEGAALTLQKFRPILLMESSDPLLRNQGSSAKALIRQCELSGYKVLDAHDAQLPPGTSTFADLLCVPMENMESFAAMARTLT